jgi:peptide/nickel transport system permease protein
MIPMLAYSFRRFLAAIPLLLLGLTLTFFIIHLAPGDPTTRLLSPNMNPNIRIVVEERFGLNESLPIQYFRWLSAVLFHFDFGYSFQTGQPVKILISKALMPTILVTGCALLFSMIIGIGCALPAAIHKGKPTDQVISSTMLVFYSMPAFWLALILLNLFAVKLDWFPVSQLTSLYHGNLSGWGQLFDYLKHLILPVFSLALGLAASFFKYIREAIIEALQSDFIKAARARGLPEKIVIFRYALKHGFVPVISLLGLAIPLLFSGAVVIEIIFALPGLGRVMVDAVMGRDYPVILATANLSLIAVILGNFLADIAYTIVDPRVRLGASKQ